MPRIINSKTRAIGSRAPVGSVSLNKASPQAQGIERLFYFGQGRFQELVRQDSIVDNTTAGKFQTGLFGNRVFSQTDAGTDRLSFTQTQALSPYTFVIWVKYSTSESSVLCGNAARTQYALSNSGSNGFYSRTSAGYSLINYTFPNNTWMRLGVTNNGLTNGLKLYRDGKQVGSSETLVGTLTVSALLGYDVAYTFALNGRCHSALISGRYWSDADFAADYAPQTRWDLYWRRRKTIFLAASQSATLTGTATSSITEADIVAGGKIADTTVTGDTLPAAGTAFDAQRQNYINGFDSAQTEATGWNAEVRDKAAVTTITRISDTVYRFTLPATASYDVTAQETITNTIPASGLVTSTSAIVATPTFTVDFVDASITPAVGSYPYIGLAPSINEETNIKPAVGISKYIGLAPSINEETNIKPAVGISKYIGQSVNINAQENLSIDVGSYSHIGEDVLTNLSENIIIFPGTSKYIGQFNISTGMNDGTIFGYLLRRRRKNRR